MKTEDCPGDGKDATGGIRRGGWRSGIYIEAGLEGGGAVTWVEWTGLAGLHQVPNTCGSTDGPGGGPWSVWLSSVGPGVLIAK